MDAIEGYDILEKIGEGGMGQVFKAVHRRLDRPVAIKRLAPQLSHNQDMLRRFLQEARLQARLTHPNVVNIFDLIENDQGIFLVMEYVEGQTARDMLHGRDRLSMAESLMIAEGVLRGLAFMHRNGVVHRDIKPSNIMVSMAGTVKVTDFGIARLVGEDTGLTRFGGGIGTLHYMAPELIKSGEVSYAIDLYSLGATLHELLSGAPPFTGNTDLEIMMGHLEREPGPLDLPDDPASQACEAIVATALAKNPADRFASAEAFLAAVRQARALLRPHQPQAPEAPAPAEPQPPASPAPEPEPVTSEAATAATPLAQPEPLPEPEPAPGQESSSESAPAPEPEPESEPELVAPKAAPPPAPDAAETGPPETPPSTTPAPARGRKGLLIGLGAAVLGLVLYLALRPSAPQPSEPTPAAPTTPAPASVKPEPTQPASVPAPAVPASPTTPVAGPGQAVAEPSAPAPSPTPAAPSVPATVATQAPLAEQTTAASEAPPAPAAPPDTISPTPAAPESPQASPATPEPSPAPAAAEQTPKPDVAEPAAPPAGPETAVAPLPAQPETSASVPAEPQPSPPPTETRYVVVADSRLRDAPDLSSNILKNLDPGTPLAVQEIQGAWLRVTDPDGQSGYILARLTARDKPSVASPPVQATQPSIRPKPHRASGKSSGGDQSGWRIVK